MIDSSIASSRWCSSSAVSGSTKQIAPEHAGRHLKGLGDVILRLDVNTAGAARA